METSALNRSISEIRRSFKTLNSSMRTNLNNLRYGESSLKNYETHIESLNKDIKQQEKNLADTKKRLEEYHKAGKGNTRTAHQLAQEYNRQADSLNRMKQQLATAQKEMRKLQVESSGIHKMGKRFQSFGSALQGVSNSMRDMGRSLTNSITKPATVATSALAGITLVKGFDRLVGIDSARAKLVGLGHDAEGVDTIMNSALESVKGTAFGMDEAATTAAAAVAAGIEPGKELTRYLSLTGDAAAIAGVSLAEMGSIINQVQTSGTAYTDNLNQLADRGIPIYQWIAEEAGIAAEEVKDFASEGKISSEMFLAAIENNIGGAAKKIDEESFTAAIDNMWAAVGRLGAAFLDGGEKGEGFFSQLKPLINDFTDQLDGLDGVASTLGEKFGAAFAGFIEKIREMKQSYDELSPTIQGIINKVALFGGAVAVGIGPLLTGFGLFAGVLAKAISGIGNLFQVLAPILTPMKNVGKAAGEAGTKVSLLSRIFSFLGGPVGIAIGVISTLVAAFVTAYQKSETFRDIVDNAFQTIKEVTLNVFGIVASFIQEKIGQIKSFWDSEGPMFLEAWRNIWNGISTVVSPIIDGIVAVVQWAFPHIVTIIKGAFTIALEIVKSIWNAIKGVIDGGLRFIQGLIQTFSGLFTGDFSKMWEGIKNIFSGAVQFIWNFVQLTFFGKLLKGVVGFVRGFRQPIVTMWGSVRETFNNVVNWIVNFVRNGFNSMRNTITNITTRISNIINSIWNSILSFFRSIIKTIVDFVRNSFTNMRNAVGNIFDRIRSIARTAWNAIKDNIINPVRNAVSTALNRFRNFRDQVSSLFRRIKDNVTDRVKDMIDVVKGMPKKMGDGLKKAAGGIKNGIKAVINTMTEWLGKGVNGVISGINWVLDKLGVDGKISKWTVPEYAHGTDGHPGGPAIVGDGVGSNAGSELVVMPDGSQYLSPDRPTLTLLPKGTHVIPAKITKEILDAPQYAWGTIKKGLKTGWTKVKSGVKNVASKVKDTAVGIWEYVQEPSKLLDIALETIGVEIPSAVSTIGKIARGGFNYVKDKAVGYIKDKVKEFMESVTVPAGKGAKAWRPVIYKAAARMGEKVTEREVNGIIAQIQRESGGNEKIVQSSAVWDINMARGNPARGLLQYIPQTFRAYAVKGHNNIYSGYDQLLAFFNNKNWRKDLPYGRRGWGPTGGRKFATGGLVKIPGLYQLAEEGYPEWVIPTAPHRRTDAMKLLALAAKSIQGNKRPKQLPNVGNTNGNDRYDEVIDKLTQQVQLLTELVVSNRQIANKPVLTEGDIARAYNRYDAVEASKQRIFRGRGGI